MTDAERLAAYDRLYADLLRERDQVLSRLEEANRTLSRLEGEKAELEGRKTVLEAERRTHRRLDALELDRRYTQARQDLEAARRQADGTSEARH